MKSANSSLNIQRYRGLILIVAALLIAGLSWLLYQWLNPPVKFRHVRLATVAASPQVERLWRR